MTILAIQPLCQDVEKSASAGTFSTQSTVKRSVGPFALQCNPTTTAVGWHRYRNWAATAAETNLTQNTLYFTFHFRYATKPAANTEIIFQTLSSAFVVKLVLCLNSSGNLLIRNRSDVIQGTGTTVLDANTWYRIGVRGGNGTSATYELYVAPEGEEFGAAELSGTCDQGAVAHGVYQLGKSRNFSGNTVDFFFQDCVVDDAQVHGPFNIGVSTPIGAGNYSDWTGGTYADVDEIPNDSTTTMITASASGDKSSFDMQSAATIGMESGATIPAVCVTNIRRRSTSINSRTLLRSGVTDSYSTNSSDSASFVYRQTPPFLTDPQDSATWTVAKFDALEGGVNRNAAGGGTVDCTQSLLLAMFTNPATGGIPIFQYYYQQMQRR